MKTLFYKLALIALAAISPEISFAQSCSDTTCCSSSFCCCNTDRSPAGVMISHVHEKNQWMFSYRYMNTSTDHLMEGTRSISRSKVYANYQMAPESMQMNMHMLMGMYGVNDKLTLMGMLNYSTMTMSMASDNTMQHDHSGNMSMDRYNMTSSGLGDLKLFALYSILKSEDHQLLANIGMSVPTGSISRKGKSTDLMYSGQRLAYNMQLGTGTVDFMPGMNYLYQNGKITIGSQISGSLRTGNNFLAYHLGNEINLNNWIAYQCLNVISSSVRMEMSKSGKINGRDPSLALFTEPSANPLNYGGEKITCYVGAVFQAKKGFWKHNRLAAEYGLPVHQNLNGIQMAVQQVLYGSWSFQF